MEWSLVPFVIFIVCGIIIFAIHIIKHKHVRGIWKEIGEDIGLVVMGLISYAILYGLFVLTEGAQSTGPPGTQPIGMLVWVFGLVFVGFFCMGSCNHNSKHL